MDTTVHSTTPAHTVTLGRTISVEKVGDVPELAGLPALTLSWERVVVERHDGKYVRQHGLEFSVGVRIEDAAHALVVKLTSRRETADYRYIEAPQVAITAGVIAQDDDPYWECDDCTCCSAANCHTGPDSGCPTDSLGDFACPCTGD